MQSFDIFTQSKLLDLKVADGLRYHCTHTPPLYVLSLLKHRAIGTYSAD